MRALLFLLILIPTFNFKLNGQTNCIMSNVPQISQINSQWCWAASIQMILKSNNITYDQCQIVQEIMPNVCGACPTSCAGSTNCSQSLCVDKLSVLLNYFCLNSIYSNGSTISWNKIKQQCSDKTPFIVGVYDPGTSIKCNDICSFSHYVVGRGYRKISNNYYIQVRDPYKDCSGFFISEVRN